MKLTMELMQRLGQTCDQMFAEYSQFINDLSQTVEQNKDTKHMIADFQAKLKKKTENTWQPFFNFIDDWKRQLDNSTNTIFYQNGQNASGTTNGTSWNPFKW